MKRKKEEDEEDEEFEECEDGRNCPYVQEEVCEARMKALDTKLKYLFGSSILTIALIITEIALKFGVG